MSSFLSFIYFFLFFIVICLLGYVSYVVFRRGTLSSLKLRLLLIKVPKKEQTDQEKLDVVKEIGLTEQLLSAFASLEEPFVLEASVDHGSEAIRFYVAVSRESTDFAMRQIQGLFPDAHVEEVSDYNVFGPTSGAAGAHLSLAESHILPVRTYAESGIDTFSPIASTLSQLREAGEGASIQFVVRPASKSFKNGILSAINRLKKGDSFKDILRTSLISLKDIESVLAPKKKKAKEGEPKIIDEEAIKVLQQKIAKPLFAINARIVTAADTRAHAEDILTAIIGSFSQFSAPLRNSIAFVKPKDPKRLFFNYSFREFDPKQSVVLNTEEIASMFHVPTFTTNVPRVDWLKTRESAPPANLSSQGVVLGESVFRGESRPVRLSDDDRRRHLYIVGQTGTGKTYLQLSMAVQDIMAGKGVCVIDPHGDQIDDILSRIPRERIDDVIVFNPADLKRPLGLNMLEYDFERPEEKTFIVNELQSIFNRLFTEETMGPQFQQYMRYALLLLMEDAPNEPATLAEVPRLFTDPEFRKRKLARIKNPSVIDFWEKEASKTSGEQGLANMTPYITSKFGNFIANDYMRPIIGQTKSSFNFREIMDDGKILLVNLAKGKIGDINAELLGMIITSRMLMAALSRVDISDPEKRKDFYFYIDEFQNFTTDSISVILSEARKYRLNLILAHQFIGQLTDEIKNAVFGNVGSMVVFRVGVPDPEILIKNFAPEFTEKDLLSIDNYNAHAKLLIGGQPSKAFNLRTLRIAEGNTEVRDKLKELSRLTYGADGLEVEREMLKRLRS